MVLTSPISMLLDTVSARISSSSRARNSSAPVDVLAPLPLVGLVGAVGWSAVIMTVATTAAMVAGLVGAALVGAWTVSVVGAALVGAWTGSLVGGLGFSRFSTWTTGMAGWTGSVTSKVTVFANRLLMTFASVWFGVFAITTSNGFST